MVGLIHLILQLLKRIMLFVCTIVLFPLATSSQSFVRVNSGTKADITHVTVFKDNEGFFLADRIYSLSAQGEWKKSVFPSIHPISQFSANSADDFYYATNLENSTSILYHYHDRRVDEVVGPFGVSIFSMSVSPDKIPYFASFSEVASLENGLFKKTVLVPTRSVVKKIVAGKNNHFWVLTQQSEMFIYDGANYKRILKDKKVADFQILEEHVGFALCEDELVQFSDSGFRICSYNNEFRKVEKFCISKQQDIWMIGQKSKVLKYSAGQITDLSPKEHYNLRDIAINDAGEVWIAGNDGVLLYWGKKSFIPYKTINPGFSSFKLSNYSIDLDNEYGVALADLDGDNKIDIFSVCISDVNRLFINIMNSDKDSIKGNFFKEEGFIRKSEGAIDRQQGVTLSPLKLGVSVADVDNDGDEDIFICYLNAGNKLLLNNGNGVFRDVSNQPFRAGENLGRSTAAAFADVDLDGFVDLYVTSENGSNKLFHNDGTGHFTDITVSAGLETISGGSCATFSDINNDGYPDLCATFWYGQNRIYLNETKNGVVKFRDITALTDLSKSPAVKSNGATFADINNDGFPDLFVANRNDENKLYLNDGHGIFKDVTANYFEHKTFLSNGGVFADFDQDGYLDLYLTNVGENILYKNIAGKYFQDVTSDFGAELSGYCTGAAVGDLNNDGNVDIYAANYLSGSSKVFLNQSKFASNLKIKLEGTLSNRDAIGAKVYLYKKNKLKGDTILAGYQEISGGSGYASISAKEVIFPLNQENNYWAIVKFPFPGSNLKIDDLKPGLLVVKEQLGLNAFVTMVRKSAFRMIKDPEILKELLKTLIILLILLFYFKRYIKGKEKMMWIRRSISFAIFGCFLIGNLFFIYTTSPFMYFLPILIAIILMVIMHLVTERMQISLNIARQRMMLREKISRDLHDDLASTLGSISIYSDTLKRLETPLKSDFKKLSLKIAELTQSALQSITDIIWMTSPKNDSLQGLMAKTNNLLYETLIDNGIQYHAEINLPDLPIVLPDELKNDTFLILKEGTHNIIKHAKATNVKLIADVNGNECSISLMDDGIGFDERNTISQVSHGNGLINIRKRAHDSKIEISIHSREGNGTIISLKFKI